MPTIPAAPNVEPPTPIVPNPKIIGGPMYAGGVDGNVDDPLFQIITDWESGGDDTDPNVSVRLVSER